MAFLRHDARLHEMSSEVHWIGVKLSSILECICHALLF